MLISLGGLLLSSYILLQLPSVQTIIAKRAVKALETNINGKVHIDRIAISFFSKVAFRGIEIIGPQNDTLTAIKRLSVDISITSLLQGNYKIKRLIVDNGVFSIHTNTIDKTSNISDIFGKKEKKDSIKPFPKLSVKELKVNNFRFNLTSSPIKEQAKTHPESVNYQDMQVKDINVYAKDFKFEKGNFLADVQHISFKEKSGLNLHKLSGKLTMNKKLFKMDDFVLIDDYSHLQMFPLSFEYDSPKALKGFVEEMNINAEMKDAKIDFRTIAKFTPSLLKNKLCLIANGKVTGPVAALHLDDFTATTPSGITHIDLEGSLIGIPEMGTSTFDFDIKEITTEIDNFHGFVSNFSKDKNSTNIEVGDGIPCKLVGKVDGILDNLSANLNMNSPEGVIKLAATIENIISGDEIVINGKIETDSLNIGAFLDNELVGKTTMLTELNAKLHKKNINNSTFSVSKLQIDSLLLNDYTYSNIIAVGDFANDIFDGKVICHDPNLDFIFQGKASIPRGKERENMVFNFYADIPFADITAMNISKKPVSEFSFKTMVNISTNSSEDVFGTIDIQNLSYQNSSGKYDIGKITGSSSYVGKEFAVNLNSSFLTAQLSGSASPLLLIDRLKEMIIYDNFGEVFEKKTDDIDTRKYGNYQLSILTHNTDPFAQILVPKLYIADSTYFNLSLKEDNSLNATFNSRLLKLKDKYIKNFVLNINNLDKTLACNITSDIINYGVKTENNHLKIGVNEGLIKLNYLFDNETDIENKMSLNSNIFFEKNIDTDNIITHIDIDSSNIIFQSDPWQISKSRISLSPKNYHFKDFMIANDNQRLSINGHLSETDTLDLVLNDLDISIINSFMDLDTQLKGRFTGKADIINMFSKPGILINLQGDSVSVFGNEVGHISLLSKWDDINKKFNVLINNIYQNKTPLNVSGYYRPDSKDLDLKVALNEFAVTYFEPLLSSIIHTTSGSISGDMHLTGKLDKLNLISTNSHFNNFGFTLDYTNVPYVLNGPFILDEDGVKFSNVTITDKFKKAGKVTGGLRYKYFKDINLNTKIALNNMHCLNTKEVDNNTYYGDGFATGIVNLSGPLNKLFIDISINTLDKTAVHIPLAGMSSATKTDLLKFTKKEIPLTDLLYDYINEQEKDNGKKKTKSELSVNLKIGVQNTSRIFLELNKDLGNVIESRGQGIVEMQIDPSKGVFDIRGDYAITDGKYKFVVLGGVLSKDFSIQPGGTINFNGDIMKSNLDITAVYKTKASISTLIADTSSVTNRRPVNCGIKMTGPLSNPRLGFSIDIDDLEPVIKGRVDGALSTEDKILKQFMALLVTGSFIPDEQSSIVNNTAILYSNASEILANQVNNVFRQLGIPLDLGLNYQPGVTGEDIFDVALSFQAFNNRVVIDGNVGTNNNTSKTGDITGNFEAEVKLDKQGKLRLSLFTKAADDFSNYLDNSQRHGIGINYQSEFDTFKELWQTIFLSRKKREQLELKEIEKYQKQFLNKD